MYYLGSLKFSKATETPVSESYGISHTYAEIKPAVGKPSLQSKGPNLVDLNVELYFHIKYCRPSEYIKTLFTMVEEGQTAPYYHDNGEFRGNFQILDMKIVSEKRVFGVLVAATVSLSFKQCSDAQFLEILQAKYAEPALVDPNMFTDPPVLGVVGSGNFDLIPLKDIARRP